MRRTALRVARLLPLLLVACRGPQEAEPVAPAPAPEPTPQAQAPASARPATPPELCATLAGVLASDIDGFARLRGARLAGASWTGTATVPGTERCTIEGEAWPRARYVCDSRTYRPERRARALADFTALASQIDRCLAKPIWFPRDWRRGELFEFAMGERLLSWTDRTTEPPAAVVLKVQQDLRSHGYRVRLDLETVR